MTKAREKKSQVNPKPKITRKRAKKKSSSGTDESAGELLAVSTGDNPKKVRLPARPARTIIRRSRAPKPDWLSTNAKNAYSKAAQHKRRLAGIEKLMSSWSEFIKVPLVYLEEEELEELLRVEVLSRKRWAIANRLHSALCSKRAKRERTVYRKQCGLQ